jgi:hypothetical protein
MRFSAYKHRGCGMKDGAQYMERLLEKSVYTCGKSRLQTHDSGTRYQVPGTR